MFRRPLGQTLAAAVLLVATSALAAPLDQQIQRVEKIRHLTFSGPVRVVTLDRAELPAHLRAQFTKTLPYSIDQWAEIMTALQLVDAPRGGGRSGEALLASLLDLYQSQVLAYYDPVTHAYYAVKELPAAVAGMDAGQVEEGVAIHELTHALQDQRFHIGKLDEKLRNDSDAAFAVHALAEGEASLVMMAAMAEVAGVSLDDLVKNEALVSSVAAAASLPGVMGKDAPPYFVEMMKFPYIDGLRFAIEAYRRGGWGELDRVWADPPRSTREVLHPEDYFGRRFRPQPFSAKPPLRVANLLSVEHLGEFHWAFLAGAENARGWTGDRVTVARDAVLVETSWDSEQAAHRFHDAYMAFLKGRGLDALARIDGRDVRVAYGADRGLIRRFLGER